MYNILLQKKVNIKYKRLKNLFVQLENKLFNCSKNFDELPNNKCIKFFEIFFSNSIPVRVYLKINFYL